MLEPHVPQLSSLLVSGWPIAMCGWLGAAVMVSGGAAAAQSVKAESTDLALPDPLTLENGQAVASPEAWTAVRRPQIRALFERYVYGRVPANTTEVTFRDVERDETAFGGKATRKQVRIEVAVAERKASLDLLLYVPNDRASPRAPAFLGLNFYGNHSVTDDPAVRLSSGWLPKRGKGVVNNRATDASRGSSAKRWVIPQTLARGYAVATLYHGDMDPDFAESENGVHALFYRAGQTRPADDEWGALAAWAWGLSRAMDYLETDPDIDARRVAVVGHSRNGKTALLAGAMDQRFAVVISNHSGCGGAAVSRRRVGETVKRINTVFPHWFCANFKAFNDRESELPVDQHMLVALCAPRPVLVCSAVEDRWADPEGEFLALVGADPVYRLLGTDGLAAASMPGPDVLIRSTLGYHIRPGRHGIGAVDWAVFAAFVDRHLRDQ